MGTIHYIKVAEDPDILFLKDEVSLASGASFTFKDFRGFTIAILDEDGNLKIKGEVSRI